MTVSYALRGHPKIPKVTRDLILETARKLNYVPDPMLSALMAYRRPSSQRYISTIAWIVNHAHPTRWKSEVPVYRGFWEGAEARCLELGYHLEPFWLREPGMTSKRFCQILQTRNINAAILMPQPTPRGRMKLNWDNISTVTIGHTLVEPRLHMVAGYQYRSFDTIMRRLRALGYRRIGYCIDSPLDERSDHSYLAGFLVAQQRMAPRDRIPYTGKNLLGKSLLAWVRRNKPQVIITANWNQTIATLRGAGYRVPEDIGVVAGPPIESSEEYISGIDEQPRLIGSAAVDLLHSVILRNERGIPANPLRVFVDGVWKPNKTVRRINR